MWRLTRRTAASLAASRCVWCRGSGVRQPNRLSPARWCHCVYRRIFCLTMRRWRLLAADPARLSPTRAEFLADVEISARRALDEKHWRLFQERYLGGKQLKTIEWYSCASNRAAAITRIQLAAGRSFVNTRPYRVFPPDEYLSVRTP